LDLHTLSSTHVGDDEFGHPQFDTKRSPAGELLYRLKYRADRTAVPELVEALVSFVCSWRPPIDAIVPVPPTRARSLQPVLLLGEALGKGIGVDFGADWVRRAKDVPESKNVFEYHERVRLLADAHDLDESRVAGRKILIFDDLYRSGATMNSVAAALEDRGRASETFALTLTRTRSRR
jgi:predicted amidophosphoribosyltransferase